MLLLLVLLAVARCSTKAANSVLACCSLACRVRAGSTACNDDARAAAAAAATAAASAALRWALGSSSRASCTPVAGRRVVATAVDDVEASAPRADRPAADGLLPLLETSAALLLLLPRPPRRGGEGDGRLDGEGSGSGGSGSALSRLGRVGGGLAVRCSEGCKMRLTEPAVGLFTCALRLSYSCRLRACKRSLLPVLALVVGVVLLPTAPCTPAPLG